MPKKISSFILVFSLLIMLNGCEMIIPSIPAFSSFEVNENNLRIHTEYITNVIGIRPAGTEKEIVTANYIYSQLEEMGFSVSDGTLTRISFTSFNDLASENIIAFCNFGKSKEIIEIVTHYDSVPTSPGARDNAAGVAALLEMARILGSACESLEKEIRFVFVGAEEVGYFGSTAYVNSIPQDERINHIAAFIMDISIASMEDGAVLNCNTLGGWMDGEYVEGNWLYPANNLVSRSISKAFCELTDLRESDNEDKYWSPRHKGESDHFSFHNGEIDAGNVCWRRIDGDFALLPEEYHQMNDTTENLDYNTLMITTKCILRAVELISLGKIT